MAARAPITCFHFNFPFSFYFCAEVLSFPPGINSSYCFCLIVRLTPSIHICVRLHSAVQREAYFFSCAVPVLPLTGQISDRPGRLSYILLANRVHAGERMCEQLNWVNRGIFLPTNDLRGKHDSAFTLSVREEGREGKKWGGWGSRMCPSRILTTCFPLLHLTGHFSSGGLVCVCVCVRRSWRRLMCRKAKSSHFYLSHNLLYSPPGSPQHMHAQKPQRHTHQSSIAEMHTETPTQNTHCKASGLMLLRPEAVKRSKH